MKKEEVSVSPCNVPVTKRMQEIFLMSYILHRALGMSKRDI